MCKRVSELIVIVIVVIAITCDAIVARFVPTYVDMLLVFRLHMILLRLYGHFCVYLSPTRAHIYGAACCGYVYFVL